MILGSQHLQQMYVYFSTRILAEKLNNFHINNTTMSEINLLENEYEIIEESQHGGAPEGKLEGVNPYPLKYGGSTGSKWVRDEHLIAEKGVKKQQFQRS